MAVSALIGVSMGFVHTSFKQSSAKQFLIQSDVLLSNLLGLLKDATSQVKDADTLEIFLLMPLSFDNEEINASVEVAFASDASKPNINKLIATPDAKRTRPTDPYAPTPLNPAMEEYLENILSVNGASDTILLISLIADTVDEDLNERVGGSELALDDPDFAQGRIHNIQHFRQILDAYKLQTLDFTVDRISWEKLIGFRNDAIDFNHIESESLRYMLIDIPIEEIPQFTTDRTELYSSLESLPFESESQARLKALNVVFYDPNVAGEIVIRHAAQRLRVRFSYNLKSKEVSNIEVSR